MPRTKQSARCPACQQLLTVTMAHGASRQEQAAAAHVRVEQLIADATTGQPAAVVTALQQKVHQLRDDAACVGPGDQVPAQAYRMALNALGYAIHLVQGGAPAEPPPPASLIACTFPKCTKETCQFPVCMLE